METNEKLPTKLMILIALVQGLCLLYLHQALELDYWPKHQPHWLFALYSISLIWPVMLLLSIKPGKVATLIKYTLPFALLSSLLGYYVGLQAIPLAHISYSSLLFSYIVTMIVATFKALMYTQQLTSGEKINYSSLFRWSWRNFLTLFLSLLLAFGCWLILFLWAELFVAIEIDFFADLFEQPWFYYTTLSLANGLGIIIFRRLTNIIDTITRLQQALMKALLILITLVAVLFLIALPITGLSPLWENGGSQLILSLQVILLFCFNAVYQDDPIERPYSIWLHRFITIGIAVLPIYSAIAFYGLSLRVEQYGWSLARCWAFVAWFLLGLFPLGYWWGLIKQYDNWGLQLSRVNVAVGLVMLVMMLLVNSPLLDFRKIVVNDQLSRLEHGLISIEDFDLYYFRNNLAKPGYNAIEYLKTSYQETHPSIVLRINQLFHDQQSDQPSSTKEEFIAAISIFTESAPPALLEQIYLDHSEHSWRTRNTTGYYLQSVDLNRDGRQDYLLAKKRFDTIVVMLYYLDSGQWQSKGMRYTNDTASQTSDSFLATFKAGKFQLRQPQWQQVDIDGYQLQVTQ